MELAFGEFRLDVTRRMLWQGQSFVTIGARAYSILETLLENPGRLVSKAGLMERAWPGISVDEANLRIQIANLRKALGASGNNVTTEQSLGYRFTGDVRRLADPNISPASQRFRTPLNSQTPIGRERSIASVREAMRQHRLISIIGPGGIGKTTLAIEIAGQLEETFVDGVSFVDLAMVSDSTQVSSVVGTALARRVLSDPLADIVSYLRTRRMLLVLDCCERVVEGVSDLIETVLSAAPGITIIVTSREATRLPGEFAENLEGLEAPEDVDLTAEAASGFSAIALFRRTAQSHSQSFELNDRNVGLVAGICRRMDGIPLAIDLAAGLARTLDLKQIHDDLAERMSILTFARRGGLPRHRTLEAAIAWSYDTLDAAETKILRRLSVFDGSFTLEGAVEVATFGNVDSIAAKRAVISLAQKSLLRVTFAGDKPTYSLLETTRQFASTRVSSVDELRTAASNHARHVLKRLNGIDWKRDSVAYDRRHWVALALEVGEALAWAYADIEDALLPVRLAVAAERLWLELGLFAVHSARMKEARSWLERFCSEETDFPALLAAVLSGIAYGVLYETTDNDRINVVLEALRRSKDIDDKYLHMRNLSHAYFFHALRHHGHLALNFAEQLREEAAAAGRDDIASYATVGAANARLQIGDWKMARQYMEEYLARGNTGVPCETIIYLGFNTSVFAYFSLAILEGMEGHTSKCFEYIDKAIELTDDGRQAPMRFQTLCFVACRMAFRLRDLDRAQTYLDLLEHQARDFAPWQTMTTAYHAWMAYSKGDLVQAKSLLEADLAKNPFAALTVSFYLLLADVRLALGDIAGAEEAAEKTAQFKTGDQDPFAVGPALRVRADIYVARGAAEDVEKAAELYSLAIDNARRHAAITFEIPAAIGLARLEVSRDRHPRALEILKDLDRRVTDGRDLPPMQEVAKLIADLDGLTSLSQAVFTSAKTLH